MTALPSSAPATGLQSQLNPADWDNSIKAGDDFYLHANGNWLRNNPIPSNASAIGTWSLVGGQNITKIQGILESAAQANPSTADDNIRKLGDFYYSGMDVQAIEAAGINPLHAELHKIHQMTSAADVQHMVAYAQLKWAGSLFDVGTQKDSDTPIILPMLTQSGLGLPSPDLYSKTDDASVKLQQQYLAHIEKMLSLLGEACIAPAQQAQAAYEIEKRLAAISTAIDKIYPVKKYSFEVFAALCGSFDVSNYLHAIGAPKSDFIFASPQSFFAGLGELLTSVPVADWQAYFRWHLLKETASFLPAAFANESFHFFSTVLRGIQQQQPRWSNVVNVVNSLVEDLVGQAYVDQYFPPDAKNKAVALIEGLRTSFHKRIQNSDWLSPPTKQQALEKLAAMDIQAGYPKKWTDYSGLKIDRNSYVTNVLNAGRQALKRTLAKIGFPQNPDEWLMGAQQLNSYNDPFKNQIVFPAAMWQPPFFDHQASLALNYGAIGAVIGHEMTHGFDNNGHNFDAHGNLKDWWTPADLAEFNKRTNELAAQVSACTIPAIPPSTEPVHLNGNFTLGENIADLGGLLISWDAFQLAKSEQPQATDTATGLSPDEEFFFAWARLWRANVRPEFMLQLLQTDAHPPASYRVNIPLTNADPFYNTFSVVAGNTMFKAPSSRIRIW